MKPIKGIKMLDWATKVIHVRTEHSWSLTSIGMHGGWHTRQRLASAQLPTLGKWIRECNLPPRGLINLDAVRSVLPPECVSTGRPRKLRSPRADVSLGMMVMATPADPKRPWHIDKDEFRRILDLPVDEIEAMAVMNTLPRIVT